MEEERDQARASLEEEREKNRILTAEGIRASARAEHLRKSRARVKKRELRLESDVIRRKKEIAALTKEVQEAQNHIVGCKISNMVNSWEEYDDTLNDVLAEIGEGVGIARELKKQVEEVIGAVFPTSPCGQKLAECMHNVLHNVHILILAFNVGGSP
ncbi:hypothetical protein CCACVL1_04637 [Corchorus capsularis]|uniref:Uncharacterized protein n=1 Tax=Corchorus capsularis TaxID=210143 RepID=A0A1R3JQG6_COCAP|nr:hypothetical protein CCACVL1_04637 [Corchorus capsularis]